MRLPTLDKRYWGAKALSKIASLIGTPIMIDQLTLRKERIAFARVLVEMEIGGRKPEKVVFENECGQVIEQIVKYEWQPVKCNSCSNYDHESSNCKKQ
ncbi:hypothetical protein L6164_033361 [Bauhinia variegata]|uniref:Uncharacterized protein n=1 Tax=Bauhinia variegata TaxID=167791 RepID=A0ACB9KRM1_BAUVA|nr:hypothetical protein L6164_033361 [Bauhinia variegata]